MTAFHPANTEEVAALVRQGQPLEIIGRGSKRGLGHEVRAATQLHLDRLDAMQFYEPDEMVVSVGAGMELAALERTLAGRRQRLAFAPPDWGGHYGLDTAPQSIGGVVATNLSGSARLSAGAARDHLIGFTAVNGRGEVFKAGGRVVKNVTGYDLCKLMSGSFGTLAVMTELILRVLPMPEHEATLLLPREAAAAIAAFSEVLGGPYETVAAAWLPASLSPSVGLQGDVGLLKLEGLEASVRERCAALAARYGFPTDTLKDSDSTRLWRALGDGAPLSGAHAAIWRVSVPPAQGAALLAAFPAALGWLDWAGGLAWLALPDDANVSGQLLRAKVATMGGHATLVRADAAVRAQVPAFHPQPKALAALTARVKASFDPDGLLNPGRMG